MGWDGRYIERTFLFLSFGERAHPSLSSLTAWNWIGPRRHICRTIYLSSSQNCKITNITGKIKLFYILIYIIFIHILFSFIFWTLKTHYFFGVWDLGENYKSVSTMGVSAGNKLLLFALYAWLCWDFDAHRVTHFYFYFLTPPGQIFGHNNLWWCLYFYRWICVIL